MLADGRSELDVLCELVADDGGLMEDPEGVSLVDRAAIAADWGDPVLTVIEQHLRGELADDGALAEPIQILLAGIWPWGSGVPSSDDEWNLIHRQVMVNLTRTALLGS